MRLSVCSLTSEPPGRLAAVLAPLRELADEVVIAVDARVDEAMLPQYAALADQVHRLEYVQFEQHLAWLLDRCRGDWILHLDGDEVPSDALVQRLPGLLDRRDLRQVLIRRAWLWPDARHELAEPPWSTDYNNRLLRNDGTLQTYGMQHGHAVAERPLVYVAEPLYHLDLLLNAEEDRADKAIAYEVQRPGLLADGGHRLNEAFYLPERRLAPRASEPIPDVDLARIEAVLTASTHVGVGEMPSTRVACAAETTRGGRGLLPESAYRARIVPITPPLAMAPGETRPLVMRFHNDGSATWPRGDEVEPLIRPASRWYRDGVALVQEGRRCPFGADVPPGTDAVWPVFVTAPAEPGRFECEVDLVHEGVRWFGVAVRIAVEVAARPDPMAPRLHPSLRPRGPQVIPSVLHRIWLGGPVPAELDRFWQTLRDLHPTWRMQTWTERDLDGLGIGEERARARNASELSNLMRYEILHRHGGVYVDADVEGLRPLDDLLGGIEAFAALELPGRAGTAVLGSVAGHPVFERAARLARRTLGLGAHSANANGPYMLTQLLEQESSVHIFAADVFYPYLWDEPERRHGPFPGAYLVHHWKRSWWASQ